METVQKGKLLIAQPSILNDVSFKRSIILLTEYSQDSSVGFILNRPTPYVLNDLLPDIDISYKVYEGGPVEQDNLYFIHRVPHLLPGSVSLSSDLYWGGDFQELKELLKYKMIKDHHIRFFLGYSGWTPLQLDGELESNFWFVADNTYQNVLDVNEQDIWKHEMLRKGGEYRLWANAPADINSN